MAVSLPPFQGSTVEVSIIHAGRTSMPAAHLFQNHIDGHDILDIHCYSFLVENKRFNKKILYDLGIMKAWKEKLPPSILALVEETKATIEVERDVADQLRGADIPLDSINAIMLSHYHVDHIGDPSLFPSTTSLVVGPGFKTNKSSFPGYPKNPDALTVDDAFHGRDIVELEFSNSLEIGGFPAIDYFGDGSFYILQSEGHTHDHICALARTSDDTFIFLGGDTAHHPGEYRPTQHLPLPDKIEPSPFDTPTSISACPGKLFETIHPAKEEYRDGSDYKTSPFYKLSPTMNASLSDAEVAVEKMQVMDGLPNVFVIIAHDTSLLDILPFLPSSLNNWPAAGYKRIGAWRFLRDFKKTIRLGEST